MPSDPDRAEAIRDLTFPRSWAWRGYDAAEVDKFLDRLAGWLDDDRRSSQRMDSPEMESEVIEMLKTTIEGLERQVVNGKRRERRLVSKLEEAQGRLSAAQATGSETSTRVRHPSTARRRARGPQRIDLNKASFVDLRNLGLGVAPAARLIAMRDIRGEFKNLDVLDELEGCPEDTLKKLRRRLYVDGEDRPG
jgi:DivIVA domain-containing protein